MITIDNRGHEATIVAFSGLAPLNHVFEWTRACADLPANFVGIIDPHNCWYQRSVFRVMRGLYRLSRPFVFIGGSAGGFAALWFGKMMGADRIVAFCPQSACGEIKRELGDFRWGISCNQTPPRDIAGHYPQAIVHFAADEPRDAMHAMRIDAERHAWPRGGHDLPYRMKESGRLQDVLREAIP